MWMFFWRYECTIEYVYFFCVDSKAALDLGGPMGRIKSSGRRVCVRVLCLVSTSVLDMFSPKVEVATAARQSCSQVALYYGVKLAAINPVIPFSDASKGQ